MPSVYGVSQVALLFSRSVVCTLCDPMDCSTPDFPVPHHLPELAQTQVAYLSTKAQVGVVSNKKAQLCLKRAVSAQR